MLRKTKRRTKNEMKMNGISNQYITSFSSISKRICHLSSDFSSKYSHTESIMSICICVNGIAITRIIGMPVIPLAFDT